MEPLTDKMLQLQVNRIKLFNIYRTFFQLLSTVQVDSYNEEFRRTGFRGWNICTHSRVELYSALKDSCLTPSRPATFQHLYSQTVQTVSESRRKGKPVRFSLMKWHEVTQVLLLCWQWWPLVIIALLCGKDLAFLSIHCNYFTVDTMKQ